MKKCYTYINNGNFSKIIVKTVAAKFLSKIGSSQFYSAAFI